MTYEHPLDYPRITGLKPLRGNPSDEKKSPIFFLCKEYGREDIIRDIAHNQRL